LKEKDRERETMSVNYWTQFHLVALCDVLFLLRCKKFRLHSGLTYILHPYTKRKYKHVTANNIFVTDILNSMYIPDV